MKVVIAISRNVLPKAFSVITIIVINGLIVSQFTAGITENQYDELKVGKIEAVTSIGCYQVNLTK